VYIKPCLTETNYIHIAGIEQFHAKSVEFVIFVIYLLAYLLILDTSTTERQTQPYSGTATQ